MLLIVPITAIQAKMSSWVIGGTIYYKHTTDNIETLSFNPYLGISYKNYVFGIKYYHEKNTENLTIYRSHIIEPYISRSYIIKDNFNFNMCCSTAFGSKLAVNLVSEFQYYFNNNISVCLSVFSLEYNTISNLSSFSFRTTNTLSIEFIL